MTANPACRTCHGTGWVQVRITGGTTGVEIDDQLCDDCQTARHTVTIVDHRDRGWDLSFAEAKACPWYLYATGRTPIKGVCESGCHEEPRCQTYAPWPDFHGRKIVVRR